MKKKQWKAAIYLRLSKEDGSVDESSSIKNQREIIKDFISKNSDIKIVSERIDDGVSGVSFDRPSFNAMIEDVRDRVIDCIIVKDLSRFGRDHIEAGNYIENIFPILGVRFISITDTVDTINAKGPSDNMIIPFKNLINQTYSRDISIKSRSALDVKRKQGQFVGPFTSYGYRKSEKDKNKIVIDENVADNVREIFKMKLSGMSAEKIADYLNKMGELTPLDYKKVCGANYTVNFRTNSQTKWHAKTVLRILENPIYMGTLVQGKVGKVNYKVNIRKKKPKEEWVVVKNSHEAIIEQNMFETIQKALLLDTRTSPCNEKVYLLSGLLVCENCKQALKRKTIRSKVGTKYIYYSCTNCKGKNIKEEILLESLLKAIQSYITSWTSAEKLVSEMNSATFCKIRVKKMLERLEQTNKELEKNERYKKALYEQEVDRKLSDAEYKEYYKSYSLKEIELRHRISKIKEEIKEIQESQDESSLKLKSFKKYKNIETLDRIIILEFVEKIEVSEDKCIHITFRFKDELEKINSLINLQNEGV